ncbi:MAG: rod shape-determining protein [Sphingomonadaceae bacterium]
MNLIRILPRKRGDADVAIDFGTANTRVFLRGSGIVFEEPSLCCFSDEPMRPKLIAAGDEAHRLVDRTFGSLRIARPLARGVLNDIDAGRELLRHALRAGIGGRHLRRPRAVLGVTADATHAERQALVTTAQDAGLRVVQLVPEPLAAAFGAGLPVDQAEGSMLIECGAGTTEVVVLSLGALCLRRSVRVGGHALDQAIAEYVHSKHKFQIGAETAERVKLEIVERMADDRPQPKDLELKGHNLLSGGPGVLAVNAWEIIAIVDRHAASIVDVVRDVLNDTPPELSRDIHDRGILLTGGSASITILQHAITRATGLSTRVAQDPLRCVAEGLGRLIS